MGLVFVFFIGMCFSSNFKNLKLHIFILLIINCIYFFIYFFNPNIEDSLNYDKNIKYISLFNILGFIFILLINYDSIINSFDGISSKWLPKQFYALVCCFTIFFIIILLLNTFIFKDIKRAKITTSGIEIEIDDTNLTNTQYELINHFTSSVYNLSISFGEIYNYCESLNEKINSNTHFGSEQFIDFLTNMSNNVFGKENININFKTMSNIQEIQDDYNIPNNLFNIVKSRLNSDESPDIVFTTNNLVFLKYNWKYIEFEDELGGASSDTISIIKFENFPSYVTYGNMLFMLLSMFEIALVVSNS